MSKLKRIIRLLVLTAVWLAIGAGMFMLISAAMKHRETRTCKGYEIRIKGWGEGQLFTTKAQVITLLKTVTRGEVKGQPLSDFYLPHIENLLEQSSWVYNAELYFDNNDILYVNVEERKPLARIFTSQGESFYIDETARRIPLSGRITVDLPVFTGYPIPAVRNATDSALIRNIIATASFIGGDPFWTSQVAQIDIKNCGPDCWEMEMIPVVGNHRVNLGDGSDIASKFHRLYLFYDQVLKRKGFDKYQKIDLQFSGQVIGVKGNYTHIDSLQLRKNVENLLQLSRSSNELIDEAVGMPRPYQSTIDSSAGARSMYEPMELASDTLSLMGTDFSVESKEGKKKEAVEVPVPAAGVEKKHVVEAKKNVHEPKKTTHDQKKKNVHEAKKTEQSESRGAKKKEVKTEHATKDHKATQKGKEQKKTGPDKKKTEAAHAVNHPAKNHDAKKTEASSKHSDVKSGKKVPANANDKQKKEH